MLDNTEKIEINTINSLSKEMYSDITEHGIDAVTKMFTAGEILSERMKVNPEKEYLKRMIIAQMDINSMLLTHKYNDMGFGAIPAFREESEYIRTKIETDSILNFDEDTITSLFGNCLKIASDEEYEKWKELIYNGGYEGQNIDTLYFEEKFKKEYENETNPIKKIIKSFKYKKLFKQDALEDSYLKKVRDILKQLIEDDSQNTYSTQQKCYDTVQKGISEYRSLQEVNNIAKITLASLQQPEGVQINIEETCGIIRSMMHEANPSEFATEYRQKQVTLGSEHGIRKGDVIHTIPFEEVPKAIEDLQQRYDDAYNTLQTEEEYINEVTKIYADYIYIQPYEEGNKRTAACLLNSMLLSKGILPPPISIINNEQIAMAFNRVKNKDYIMLQDMVVIKYNKMRSTIVESGDLENSKMNLNGHKKTNFREDEQI